MKAQKKKSPAGTSPELASILLKLKKSDLKLTPARRKILTYLKDHHGPFTAEELHSKLKSTCDLVTIYRNVTLMQQCGILKRCEFGDGLSRYELDLHDSGHHHHHLICTECKNIEVVDVESLESKLNQVAIQKGFRQVSHHLEFFGTCPDCQ